VAEVQVVIVVIPKGKDSSASLNEKAYEMRDTLKRAGIRAKVDDRDNYTPGFKYNYWELRGACIRMEIGPRDMEKEQVVLVRRDNKSKAIVPMTNVAESVKEALATMQSDMFAKAKAERMVSDGIVLVLSFLFVYLSAHLFQARLKKVLTWEEFMRELNALNSPLAPW
jgi:prolyl-tRNA synthetase